jgi:hypothetical protein
VLGKAHQRRACGFDELRRVLCGDAQPSPRTLETCGRISSGQEEGWARSRERRRSLLTVGLTTLALAGVSAWGVAARDDDVGRALAIGSAAGAGGMLGYGAVTLSESEDGPLSGLSEPLGYVTGVLLGGVGLAAGALTTKEPGTSRAVVVVSSSVVMVLMSVAHASKDWR